MKNQMTSLISGFRQRILMCTLALLLPLMVQASHGTNPVSDIDYTGMGTYSGSYTHSTVDHVWVIFNANAGDVITMTLTTGFQQHYWLYRSNNGCVQVGNAAPACMTLVSNGGNGTTSGTYSYTVTATGQFAFQLDSYIGQSGSYNMTISGSTATTTLCAPSAPSFTACPGNITANTFATSCNAIVNYTATATSGTMTYVKTGATTGSGAGTGSGTSFNKGTTNVTVTATSTSTCGGSGSATCSFTVTVDDVQDPTITAPPAVTTTTDAGQCSASGVALGNASAGDNCSGVSVSNDAPNPFPIGTTTVTWTATDASGNTATATQSVTVTDNENPTITAPAAISANADAGMCSASGVNLGTATASDNCSVFVSNNAPSTFAVGTTTVTWTATDAVGNTATATQTVTVTDNQNPVISGLTNTTVSADAGSCSANVSLATSSSAASCLTGWSHTVPVQISSANAATLTNYQVRVVVNTQSLIAAGQMQPDGDDIRFSDASCTALSYWIESGLNTPNTVIWVKVPSVPNGNTTITMNHGNASAAAASSGTATFISFDDFEDGNTSGWTFGSGNWNVSNVSGNNVLDLTNPGFADGAEAVFATSLGTDYVVETDYFPVFNNSYGGPLFEYTDLANYYAMHSMPDADVTMHSLITNGNPNYNLMWSAPHNSGQWFNFRAERSAAGNKIYFDNNYMATLPLVHGNGGGVWGWSNQVYFDNFRVREYADVVPTTTVGSGGGFSVTDNCGVASIVNDFNNTADASGTYPIGTTTVTWTATDVNGNTSTSTQTVTVTDDENPTIFGMPADISVNNDADVCGATVSWTEPTSADNCTGHSIAQTAGPANGSVFPIGTSTVTYTATDASGNNVSASFTVTVTDNQNPTITAPADVTVEGYCEDAPADLGTPTASDNCAYVVTNDAPALFPVGTTVVTWTITDASNNTATATQNVTVNPLTLSISGTTTNVSCNGVCDGAIDINVDNGTAPYAYNWSNSATTQDVSGLCAGSYTVDVTDDHSCTGSASFTITEPAVLTGGITVNPNPTVAGQQANTIFIGYGPQCVTLTAAGAGGTAPYSYSWSNGGTTDATTVCPTATTTYTVTITDANGCITTVSQTIIVKNIVSAPNKVYICHNGNTLSVSVNAVPAHLAHGDYLGACNTNARTAQKPAEAIESAEELHFHVYPNPTSGMFTIELPQTGTTDVVITDVAGKVIVKQSIKDNTQQELQFNLGNEAKGIYFIQVVNGGSVYQSKITLQ